MTTGLARLAHLVLAHMIATGGVALTARVGIADVEVMRPLPCLSAKPPRVRGVLAEVLKPMFRSGKT